MARHVPARPDGQVTMLQLESDLAKTAAQLESERAAREDLSNQLTVAENAARGERKAADKLRGELNLLRAENGRLKRERDPDYDPRDGDPSLQKGVGAIPLGEHPLLNEAEHIERHLGMSPTLDQQLRDVGEHSVGAYSLRESALTAPTVAALAGPYGRDHLPKSGAGVTFAPAEALELCAEVVAMRKVLVKAAEDLLEMHPWEADDYGQARCLLHWLKAIWGRDFYRFRPVQERASDLARRVAEDGPSDAPLREALEDYLS